MNPFFQEPRPPYIEFEQRSVERFNLPPPAGDGLPYTVFIDYIIITPAGSRDRLEQEVEPYLINLDKLSRDGMFPPKWLEEYRGKYAQWKANNSFDLTGTSVRNWPALTQAEVKVLLQANIRTVEDLAAANEAALGRIGMGSRSLQSRARDWITAQSGTAPLVQQLEALRRSNEQLQAQMTALLAKNSQLQRAPTVNPSLFVSRKENSEDAAAADEKLIDDELAPIQA